MRVVTEDGDDETVPTKIERASQESLFHASPLTAHLSDIKGSKI